MTDFYSSSDKLLVAVDCIIFGLNNNELSILLTKRAFEPEKGKWSLLGGFVGRDESVDMAAQRVLSDLTGLKDLYLEQVGAFGEVNRDPGERVVSVAYCALVKFNDPDRNAMEKLNAKWIPANKLPQLGFDHPQMIAKARAELKHRFSTEPLAFNLLPELFTLTQLQNLYELILGEIIDKRNFRKRINEIKAIVPTDLIDKTCSRRGARLYHFDKEIFAANPAFKI